MASLSLPALLTGLLVGLGGTAFAATLPGPGTLILAGLGGLVLSLSGRPWCRFATGLLLGLCWSGWHGQRLLETRLEAPCEGILTGRVANLPRRSMLRDGLPRQRFELTVDPGGNDACGGLQRLLLSYYGGAEILPGQRWRFQLALQPPWGLVNEGSFNMQSWYAQTGVDAVGRVRGEGQLLSDAVGDWRGRVHRLRWRSSARIGALPLEPETIAVLQAITVADRSGIDAALWQWLQQFGINHLLVISGLHIGLVAGVAMLLGAGLGRLLLPVLPDGRATGPLVGGLALAAAGFYTALAGFSLATVRAYLMLCCLLLCLALGRRLSPWWGLLGAAVCILLHNPLAVLSSGAWLSFGAVACLLWLGQWQPPLGRGRRLLQSHAFMGLAMAPLAGWWFGGFSLLSAPVNLVLVPLVGLVLVPLALAGVLLLLLGSEWADPLWLAAGAGVAPVMRLLEHLAASSPFPAYRHLAFTAAALVFALVGVALLALPGRAWRLPLALALFLPLSLPARAPAWEPDLGAVLTVLDVGQGTAVVLRTARRTLVYDTGGGDPAGPNLASSVVLPYLRQKGVDRLDALVISHRDNDHSAGLGTLLTALPVTRLYLGQADERYPDAMRCRAGGAWRWPEGITFQFLAPALEPGLPSNDASCVLRLDLAGRSFLLPGDIGAGRERELVRYWREGLASDWLLAAHHGSISSSSLPWLKVVQAREIVFARGFGHRFGHPHPEVVARARRLGLATGDTALEGALEYRIYRDGELRRFALRGIRRRYWM